MLNETMVNGTWGVMEMEEVGKWKSAAADSHRTIKPLFVAAGILFICVLGWPFCNMFGKYSTARKLSNLSSTWSRAELTAVEGYVLVESSKSLTPVDGGFLVQVLRATKGYSWFCRSRLFFAGQPSVSAIYLDTSLEFQMVDVNSLTWNASAAAAFTRSNVISVIWVLNFWYSWLRYRWFVLEFGVNQLFAGIPALLMVWIATSKILF